MSSLFHVVRAFEIMKNIFYWSSIFLFNIDIIKAYFKRQTLHVLNLSQISIIMQRILLICIRFGTCRVRRLERSQVRLICK